MEHWSHRPFHGAQMVTDSCVLRMGDNPLGWIDRAQTAILHAGEVFRQDLWPPAVSVEHCVRLGSLTTLQMPCFRENTTPFALSTCGL